MHFWQKKNAWLYGRRMPLCLTKWKVSSRLWNRPMPWQFWNKTFRPEEIVVINLSGQGDKDMQTWPKGWINSLHYKVFFRSDLVEQGTGIKMSFSDGLLSNLRKKKKFRNTWYDIYGCYQPDSNINMWLCGFLHIFWAGFSVIFLYPLPRLICIEVPIWCIWPPNWAGHRVDLHYSWVMGWSGKDLQFLMSDPIIFIPCDS